MNRTALFVSAILLFAPLGCNPPPTVVTVPNTGDKKVDVHIRTSGGGVDVEKNKNGGTDVEVKRKDN